MKTRKYRYSKDGPEVLSFLVTSRCMCRCKHCFNWHDVSPKGAIGNNEKKDLSLDEIKRTFKQLRSLKYVYIGGGEPFIRKDFRQVIETIRRYSHPKVINISTNGQLTDKITGDVRDFLTKYPTQHLVVKISIDAIGDGHDEIRQLKGAFKKAMATYTCLKDLKTIFKHLDVGVTTVFSGLNQEEIFDIYDYLANLSPRPDCMSQLLIRATPREARSKEGLDIDRYRKWTKRYVEDLIEGKFEHDFFIKVGTILMYEYVYRTLKERKPQIRCYAGIAGAFIDNEGMVGPCEHKGAYGSLRENDYDFKKIWHSEKTEQMRYKTYNNCFCTNEPQWWHPSILHNKRKVLFKDGKNFLKKYLINQQLHGKLSNKKGIQS